MELNESRRTSWTAADAAQVYERGRPGYAEEAVDFALAPVRARPGLRALDLGAGTGKLTRQLLARDVATTAIEPAEGMRATLARAVPRAHVLRAAAEELPLPDGSVDLVVSGQAFHWFDRARALAEIARVLRPGGVLALLYNMRQDAVAWVAALSELIEETGDHVSEGAGRPPLDFAPLFGPGERCEVPHEQELDLEGLLDLVGSRSYVIRMPPQRRAALLGRVAELARTHPQLVGRQHFWMPYVTSCERYPLAP